MMTERHHCLSWSRSGRGVGDFSQAIQIHFGFNNQWTFFQTQTNAKVSDMAAKNPAFIRFFVHWLKLSCFLGVHLRRWLRLFCWRDAVISVIAAMTLMPGLKETPIDEMVSYWADRQPDIPTDFNWDSWKFSDPVQKGPNHRERCKQLIYNW